MHWTVVLDCPYLAVCIVHVTLVTGIISLFHRSHMEQISYYSIDVILASITLCVSIALGATTCWIKHAVYIMDKFIV